MTAQDLLQPPARYKLTVADYLTLDRSGAFDGMRTELIEGEIIVMNPQYRPHGFVKDELAYRLRRALEAIGSNLYVITEVSVDMGEHGMPQPDISLTTEPRGDGPLPVRSIGLLVEVSDTTLAFDLEVKGPFYASQGVPEYWVVDVGGRVIHRMWSPEGEAYAKKDRVKFGETLAAATIDGLRVGTEGI